MKPGTDEPNPLGADPRPKTVVVTGGFDALRSREVRFLQEAARLGVLNVLLWSDDVVRQFERRAPVFPQDERLYFLKAIRFVRHVLLLQASDFSSQHSEIDAAALASTAAKAGVKADILVLNERQDSPTNQAICRAQGLDCRVLRDEDLRGFPDDSASVPPTPPGRKKVLVTGSYDWLHSGHVRFFEQVSGYGALYVVVGHDANLRLLKGPGHPLVPQDERRYMVGSIRYVTRAMIATGHGWLDAEPEIQRLKPDIYAVNEDGDRGGKREYCAKLGIEYLVLKRVPAPGLPRRTSTALRGF